MVACVDEMFPVGRCSPIGMPCSEVRTTGPRSFRGSGQEDAWWREGGVSRVGRGSLTGCGGRTECRHE